MTSSVRRRPRRLTRASSLVTTLCLGLGTVVVAGAALTPASAAAPAATPTAVSVAAAASQGTDPTGGKSVVGQTSPIHDPALIIADDGTWYVYSTGRINRENGGTIQIAASHDDGTTWEYVGTVWDEIPAWIDEHFAGGELPDNLWAPEIYENDGTFYLYYSASAFGTPDSLTALATNTTLDPQDPDYEWVDQGLVVSSPVVGLDPNNPDKTFNAIDAGIVEDADGTPYMAIGSHWYGIFLVPIEWPSGKPVENWQSRTVNIADRFIAGNPIEAPFIYARDGYYYLFVSFDACCQGGDSTYKVAVGRAESVTGPYLDQDGRDMFGGGGTVVLDAHGAVTGPGGQSVYDDYLAFHYYDGSNEDIPYFPTLGLQKIEWVDDWPTFDQTVELPAVTSGPAAVSTPAGSDAVFTVTATGTPRPVAVWETSSDEGTTWVQADPQPVTTTSGTGSDSTATSSLTLPGVTAEHDGLLVRAVLHNAHGRVTSDVAALSVTAAPAPVPVPDPLPEPEPLPTPLPELPLVPPTDDAAPVVGTPVNPTGGAAPGTATGAGAPASAATLPVTGSNPAALVLLALGLTAGGALAVRGAARRVASRS